ncbi:MAG: hypothetical protein K9G11_01390 [Rickettsiaceae bacterium]|nr:hypothetical protein [Rickettsiaceae bacterium]
MRKHQYKNPQKDFIDPMEFKYNHNEKRKEELDKLFEDIENLEKKIYKNQSKTDIEQLRKKIKQSFSSIPSDGQKQISYLTDVAETHTQNYPEFTEADKIKCWAWVAYLYKLSIREKEIRETQKAYDYTLKSFSNESSYRQGANFIIPEEDVKKSYEEHQIEEEQKRQEAIDRFNPKIFNKRDVTKEQEELLELVKDCLFETFNDKKIKTKESKPKIKNIIKFIQKNYVEDSEIKNLITYKVFLECKKVQIGNLNPLKKVIKKLFSEDDVEKIYQDMLQMDIQELKEKLMGFDDKSTQAQSESQPQYNNSFYNNSDPLHLFKYNEEIEEHSEHIMMGTNKFEHSFPQDRC